MRLQRLRTSLAGLALGLLFAQPVELAAQTIELGGGSGGAAPAGTFAATSPSCGSPGWGWSNNPNTGLYEGAANTVDFCINGSDKVRVDTQGWLVAGSAPLAAELSGFLGASGGLATQTGNTGGTHLLQYRATASVAGVGQLAARARGTPGSPSTVLTGDGIFSLSGSSFGSGQFNTSASVSMTVEGTVTGNAIPARMAMSTANAAGVLTEALRIDSAQHTLYHGAAIVLTSGFGTGTPVLAANSNDSAGRVTVAAIGGATGVLTFSVAWAVAPVCFVNDQTTANLMQAVPTTGTLTINGTMVASDVISYHCVGFD